MKLYTIKKILKKNKFIFAAYSKIKGAMTDPHVDYSIAEITPVVPRESSISERKRVNLVIPSVDKRNVFGGIATALHFFEKLCTDTTWDTRIILLDGPFIEETSVLDNQYICVPSEDDSDEPHQVVAFNDRKGKSIPIRRNDIFVTTGWWTAFTFADVIRWQKQIYGGEYHPMLYLIQDYEPGFYPWSSRYMLADSTYKMEIPVYAVFNSKLLQEHFEKNGYSFVKNWCFDPTLNAKLAEFLPNGPFTPKKKQILIYGRPNTDRNAFSLVLMALQKWAELYNKADEWTILSAGEDFLPIQLSENVSLNSVGKLSLEDYSKLLLDTYAGISLMVSPHPSYPPLEMSTFGVNTITNCYAHKDLSSFNENIISLKTCSPLTIAEKLKEICENYNGIGAVIGNTEYTKGKDTIITITDELKELI